MAKERKIRNHSFSDNHPMAAGLLLILLSVFIISIAAIILDGIISIFVEGYSYSEGFVGTIVTGFILLAFYKRRFSPEFEGNLRGGNPSVALKPSIVFVVLWVYVIINLIITGEFAVPGIGSIGIALAAGIGEEVMVRGLPLSLMMRKRRDAGWVIKILIITSGIFGLMHAVNIFVGANPALTVSQVVATTGIGLLLGAIYLRSGNLWTVIILHALHDVVAFFNPTMQDSAGVMVQDETISAFQMAELLVPYIIMGGVGIWLVRAAKMPEIQAVWDKKWKFENDAQLDSDEQ